MDVSCNPWGNGLITISLAMGVGTYATGALAMLSGGGKSAEWGKVAEAAGAGLMIGACFCLILPEGFSSFYEAKGSGHSPPDFLMGAAVVLGFIIMLLSHVLSEVWLNDSEKSSESPAPSPIGVELASTEQGMASSRFTAVTEPSFSRVRPSTPARESAPLLPQAEDQEDAGWRTPLPQYGSTSRDGADYALTAAAASKPKQVLAGLLIHAAADGVAVGSASLSSSMTLTASVAFAICLHKGPVSFGLTSYLKSAGWSGPQLQTGLLSFALTSPAAALLTFFFLCLVPGMNQPGNVALALLFSGGTVLYASCVHILPDALGAPQPSGRDRTTALGSQMVAVGRNLSGGAGGRSRYAYLQRVAALVMSTLLPLIIAATVSDPE